jgi:hypothetical protein
MEVEIMQLLVLVAAVIYLLGDDGTTPIQRVPSAPTDQRSSNAIR